MIYVKKTSFVFRDKRGFVYNSVRLKWILFKASVHCDGLIDGDLAFSDPERGDPELNSELILDAKHLRG